MAKLSFKKGDTVVVISGKEKGKTGKITDLSQKKVLVDGVNIVTKHQKPKSQKDKGGLIKRPAPVDASNVMVICPVCGKATRVAHKEIAGKNARICKKCGASLDKEFVKATKKVAKKKEEKVVEEVKEEIKQEVKEEPKTTKAKTTKAKTTKAKTTAPKTAKKVVEEKTKVKKSSAKVSTSTARRSTNRGK